jgi:transcriptional regulator with XRE-family HTH domain
MPYLFKEKLRYLRRQVGLSQTELARLLSFASPSSVSHLEAGRKDPSLELVAQIASVFTVPTDYFLRDDIPIELQKPPTTVLSNVQKQSGLSFKRKLLHLRCSYAISQRDLAQHLGLASRAYVSNLEAGRKVPSPELVVRIADLFGVTTDYLLRDDVAVEGIDAQGE